MVDLTVPVEDLNVTITTQGDQEPTPIAMSPPHQAQEQEEQEDPEPQPRTDLSPPSLPDTVPMDQEQTDDVPLPEMFSSEVAQTSVSTWLTEHNQLYQTPTSTPEAAPDQQVVARASSTVSSLSHLSSHDSDTTSWIGTADTTDYTRGKFLLID